MKKIILLFVAMVGAVSSALADTISPVGYWKTIDDVSGQPKSIVQIWAANNQLHGKVVKIFEDPGKVCTECQGDKRNQPILGMVIMDGLKQSKDQTRDWVNGSILDPHNGKTYHCNLQVAENGQKLTLRGYIGMPLFGRSQTWQKVEKFESV